MQEKVIKMVVCFTVVLLSVVLLGALTGCASKDIEGNQNVIAPDTQHDSDLSRAEQNREAFAIFKEILLLSDSPEREKNLPAIKMLYHQIIDQYPDTGLAQESYLRLVVLAKDANTPEGDAEAEAVFHEFIQKHPDSRLRPVIENELKRN